MVESLMLFRPVGIKELELICKLDYTGFPPRLPHQPIFYPVLNYEYAEQIAQDWNTKDEASGYAGFVTQFDVDGEYIAQFEVKTVGAGTHQELWIPAEQLETFNGHIIGKINVVASFYGERFSGEQPEI